MTKNCIVCNKAFIVKPSHFHKRTSCSLSCMAVFKRGKPNKSKGILRPNNQPSGEHAHRWKGGRILETGGYFAIRIGRSYVKEHRYVMEQLIGRKLLSNEIVHHKNEIKTDNRPENLEIMDRGEHVRMHKIEQHAAGVYDKVYEKIRSKHRPQT